MKQLKGGQGNLTQLLTLQDACGICSLCLYNREPSGFSAISYIAVVTQVTPHDVLYKFFKATSSTQQRDSCSTSLLLSNAPYSAWRYTAKKLSTCRNQISAWNTAIVAFTQHTSAVHAHCCDNFQAMSRDYHVYIGCLSVPREDRHVDSSLRRFCHTRRWNSKHGNVLAFPCGIKAKSASAQRYI